MNAYLGIDIGTGGCKVAAFDDTGALCGFASREYNVSHRRDGGAELDSGAVIEHCLAAIRSVARGGIPPVRALGISSQGEAFTAVRADGQPLCHAMVSSDTRAAAYVEQGLAGLDTRRLYEITGHTPHPMFTLYKLMWLREHRPEVWAQTWKFLCFEDLLQHRLGLDPAMGWPLAGRTMMFDVSRHQWSPDILGVLGLMPDRLARPLQSGSVAGVIPAVVAASLGLPEGVVVVTGGHDQPCGALGAGVTEPGLAMYATGTVECITPAFRQPVFSPQLMHSNLCTYDHTAPGLYATVAFNLTGGNALKWFRDEFGQPEQAVSVQTGRDVYELLLETAGDQPSPLLCLPYLAPSGTPYFDTRTPGALLGLRLATKRGEVLRALLEGVTLEMRLNLEILAAAGCPIRELRVIGGGSKSRVWNQLKADVLNTPVTTLDVGEAGCLGAALLACAAHTGSVVGSLAQRWVKPRAVIRPRPGVVAVYDRHFTAYRALYPALKNVIPWAQPGRQ
jgi:xylulokinase